MTVSNATRFVTYAESSSAPRALSVPFDFQRDQDLLVVADVDGAETVLVLDDDYTVTGGEGVEGEVTILAPTAGTIRIERVVELTQEVALAPQGPFSPAAIEGALDKLTFIAQQQGAEASRTGARVATLESDVLVLGTSVGALEPRVSTLESAAPAAGAVLPEGAENLFYEMAPGVPFLRVNSDVPPQPSGDPAENGVLAFSGGLVQRLMCLAGGQWRDIATMLDVVGIDERVDALEAAAAAGGTVVLTSEIAPPTLAVPTTLEDYFFTRSNLSAGPPRVYVDPSGSLAFRKHTTPGLMLSLDIIRGGYAVSHYSQSGGPTAVTTADAEGTNLTAHAIGAGIHASSVVSGFGFRMEAPADPFERVLKLYTGRWSIGMNVRVRASDGSFDDTLTLGRDSTEGLITATYKSKHPGQRAIITLVTHSAATPPSFFPNVQIYGVTLAKVA